MLSTDLAQKRRYEWALRIVGRYLDSEPSYDATVVEGPTGFTVRWRAVQHRSDLRTAVITWEKVQSLAVLHTASRTTGRRRRRHHALWEHFPTGHEDFFRALGHDLDEQRACALSIDELPTGLLVCYVRPDSNGESTDRCRQVYSRDDVQALLEQAQARRRTETARVPA